MDPDNRNRVVYYDRDTPQGERIQNVIDNASSLLSRCKEEYANTNEYQLLLQLLKSRRRKQIKAAVFESDETVAMITDGAYNSEEELSSEKTSGYCPPYFSAENRKRFCQSLQYLIMVLP